MLTPPTSIECAMRSFHSSGPVTAWTLVPFRIHGHSHRHVFYFKLVDAFHAEVFKGHHARVLNRLRHQIRRPANRNQVYSFVIANRINRRNTAFSLADHAQ